MIPVCRDVAVRGRDKRDCTWDFFPDAIFYTTGQPFEWMDRTRFEKSQELAQLLARHLVSSSTVRQELLKSQFPEAVRTAHADGSLKEIAHDLATSRNRVGRGMEVDDTQIEELRHSG